MKKLYLLILCLSLGFILTGCSNIKTYTFEEKRVDQNLRRGNRGVIMGDVPTSEPERKSTRTMVGIDVELPPSEEYEARKETLGRELVRERPVMREAEGIVEEEPEISRGFADEQWVKPKEEKVIRTQPVEYTVQKGDTLQKISEKFYGTTKKWSEIYKANKNVIKDSSRIYPGQVIVIPAIEIVEVEEDIK